MGVIFTSGEWSLESACPSDCLYIADNLREDDVKELAAVSNKTPREAVAYSMEMSELCCCVKRAGVPVMLLGAAPVTLIGGEACVWAVATDALRFNSRVFLRFSRVIIDILNRYYPVMMNYVGDWNCVSLRWLEWCSFSIGSRRRLGLHGEYMRRVERRRTEAYI